MKLPKLIFREIAYRNVNFSLALAVVALAVLCVLGVVSLLRAFDQRTEQVVADIEEATRLEMAKLEDSIRKSMKGLGFNIYIFPKDQDMSEVYAEGFASSTMPEQYVTRLAESTIVTVNHLLPSLTRKMKWPEQERTVILIGIRGEVPLAHRDPKKPILDPVLKGQLVLGSELHKSLELHEGDKLTFMGREFTASKCHGERGSSDDITIWMNLAECQEMLGLEGRINAIQALECNCATVDRLSEIRNELMKILPDTQIVETQSTALARAEARQQASQTAQNQIAAKKQEREAMRRDREAVAAVLVPLVLIGGMGVVALLTLLNVRERTSEIGILRAIGVQGGAILLAFLSRAFAVGLGGFLLALLLGLALGGYFGKSLLDGQPLYDFFGKGELAMAAVFTPLLACLAAWLPCLAASRRDPAEILRCDG